MHFRTRMGHECVDRWGDSPPSHTLVGQQIGIDVTAEVSYAGTLACVTISNTTSSLETKGAPLPWFELRTTATGTAACSRDEDCELNGSCGASEKCICRRGWIGPSCGTLDVMPALTRGAWPAHRPNASSPVIFPRQYGPVSWGLTAIQDNKTKKYHAFADTGCYTPTSVLRIAIVFPDFL